MSELPPMPAYGPLNPEQWHTHEEEGDKIRYDERPASILDGLGGEPQEVTKTDRISGHRQNQANACTPAFSMCGHGVSKDDC